MRSVPRERGRDILKPKEKAGYCGVCDQAKKGQMPADEAWRRTSSIGGKLETDESAV